jgi:hypothetical protein
MHLHGVVRNMYQQKFVSCHILKFCSNLDTVLIYKWFFSCISCKFSSSRACYDPLPHHPTLYDLVIPSMLRGNTNCEILSIILLLPPPQLLILFSALYSQAHYTVINRSKFTESALNFVQALLSARVCFHLTATLILFQDLDTFLISALLK